MMSTGAFNALLKTIEEPPAHVIFILATTEPHKVLPTIISRCQRYDFTKVPASHIMSRIQLILKQEHITCEEEVIRIVAQLSDGGMRDALSIMDQCIAYAQNDIRVHHINEIYGILTVKEKLNLFTLILQNDAGKCINQIQAMSEKGMDIKRLTMDMIDLLKESIIYDYTKDVQLLHIMEEEEVTQLINQASTKYRYHMIDILMETYDKYRNAASIVSYFEICLLKMMEKPAEEIQTSHQMIDQTNIAKYQKPSKNVSRETNLNDESLSLEFEEISEEPESLNEVPTIEVIDNKSAHPLADEFVLQLLVGANKPEKQSDISNFNRIHEYTMELQWAKAANLLRNGKIMASGSNYIILVVSSQAEANEINEKDSHDEFLSFSNELLKKTKKVFAVTNEQSQRVTNNFRIRMSQSDLPSPIAIHIADNKTEKKELTEEECVIELFGKEHVMITED